MSTQIIHASNGNWARAADRYVWTWRALPTSKFYQNPGAFEPVAGGGFRLVLPDKTPLERLVGGLVGIDRRRPRVTRFLQEAQRARGHATRRVTYTGLRGYTAESVRNGIQRYVAHHQALSALVPELPIKGPFRDLVEYQLAEYRKLIGAVLEQLQGLGAKPTRRAFLEAHRLHDATIALATYAMDVKRSASLASTPLTAELRVSRFVSVARQVLGHLGNGRGTAAAASLVVGMLIYREMA